MPLYHFSLDIFCKCDIVALCLTIKKKDNIHGPYLPRTSEFDPTASMKPFEPTSSIVSLRPKSPVASATPQGVFVSSATNCVKIQNASSSSPSKRSPGCSPIRALRDQIIALRKQNFSIYDISRLLQEAGHSLSPVGVSLMLKEEGFARLPRRRDEERMQGHRPEVAEVADVRQLDLSPRHVHTQFGGLFLFLPYLAQIPLERMLQEVGFPGTKMIPAVQAVLSFWD